MLRPGARCRRKRRGRALCRLLRRHAALPLSPPSGSHPLPSPPAQTGETSRLASRARADGVKRARRARIGSVGEFQDLPGWLHDLVRGVWETPEWLTWENTWKLELAKRGVTPDMLEPLGDPRKPLAVEATPPALRRCSGKIDWTDGRSAILDACSASSGI
jgi:hypothetical protein